MTRRALPRRPQSNTASAHLDEFERELASVRVGLLAERTDRIVARVNIVPGFTYRDIGNVLAADGRFAQYMMQVVSLSGENPVELLADKLG